MARKWTEEERRKQAEAIKRWKPWEKSTRPKTQEGKERSKMNAYRHGLYGLEGKAVREVFRLNREFVRNYLLYNIVMQHHERYRR